MKWHQSESNTE